MIEVGERKEGRKGSFRVKSSCFLRLLKEEGEKCTECCLIKTEKGRHPSTVYYFDIKLNLQRPVSVSGSV